MSAVPQLTRFDHDTAWELGSALVGRCRQEGFGVTIAIWIGEQRVFHAALPGTSADNDRWVERKARIVRHFAQSSAEVHASHAGEDVESFLRVFALPVEQYFPAGGAVPVEIGGTMVGVLAVSGLASDEDHDLAVDALRRLADLGAPPGGLEPPTDR